MHRSLIYILTLLVLASCGRHESSVSNAYGDSITDNDTFAAYNSDTTSLTGDSTSSNDSILSTSPLGGLGGLEVSGAVRSGSVFSLPITPIKDHGHTDLCWIYALLATLETDHLAMGDSVNLSPLWLERHAIIEQATDTYLTGSPISLRGTLPEAMRLFSTYGIVAWDAYHQGEQISRSSGRRIATDNTTDRSHSSRVIARKAHHLASTLSAQQQGLKAMHHKLDDILDTDLGCPPHKVFMLGAEYTPLQFAHSIALPEDWQTFTSFTHHPFGRPFAVEVPDNRQHHEAMNIPLHDLLHRVIASLRDGHPVAWEGCMHKLTTATSATHAATAATPSHATHATTAATPTTMVPLSEIESQRIQTTRQRLFETHRLTDDHCMAIIGMRYDRQGRRFFICKNSWGINDGDRGLRYMSEQQFLLSTIMVMIKSEK